jgi:hypothetical protein
VKNEAKIAKKRQIIAENEEKERKIKRKQGSMRRK